MKRHKMQITMLSLSIFLSSVLVGQMPTEAFSAQHNYVVKAIKLNLSKGEKDEVAKNATTNKFVAIRIAIDDSGQSYVLQSNGVVIIYDGKGKYKTHFVAKVSESRNGIGSIEVSSNGEKIFLVEKYQTGNYFIVNANGDLQFTKGGVHYLRRSCDNVYFAEVYSVNIKRNSVETDAVFALDEEHNRIADLKTYYLPSVRLAEKPLGFFDADRNYYYLSYFTAAITKISPSGKELWQKDMPSNGYIWKTLIGIDKDGHLYAVAIDAAYHTHIVKLDRSLKIVADISLAAVEKNLVDLDVIQGEYAINNFRVTCGGDIYFSPDYKTIYKITRE